MRIEKERVLQQWEKLYAEAVLQMESDGLFIKGAKSHTNGKSEIIRTHPAFSVFKESADQLEKYNQWNKEKDAAQLKLDL
jgi:hypothetical protein